MPVKQSNRQRLRSGLLGPLGEEVTDMLMEELDQSGLRDHIDERFDQHKREIDARFDQHKKEVEERFRLLDQRLIDVHAAITATGRDTKMMVFSICGAVAVVAIAAMVEPLLS